MIIRVLQILFVQESDGYIYFLKVFQENFFRNQFIDFDADALTYIRN